MAIDRATKMASTARLLRIAFLSYIARPRLPARRPSAPPARSGILVGAVDGLELLEAATRAHRHAGERRLGQVCGHLRLVAQALVEPLQEGAAAGEHDAAVHDVARQLRWGAVERLLDRVDDRLERLLERHADLFAREHDRLWQPGDEVTPADLRLDIIVEREGRADL